MIFRRRKHSDFAEEIQAHLELERERLRAEGVSEGEAGRLARRAFGNIGSAQERFYDTGRALFLDTLARDTRFALRTLARSPGYAAAAILTLALGIGANTAVFSAIDEILFRPPDVPEPGRLAQVYSFNRKTSTHLSSSYPDFVDFQQQARSFENLSAYARFPLNVRLHGQAAERMSVESVSGNYFAMTGVAALAGRALAPADDAPGAPPAAMIAEELWRSRLGADPNALGHTVEILGQPFTIVGVVPKRLTGFNLNWATPPRLWIPLHASALLIPRFDKVFDARGALWLVLTGRLRAGVTTPAAQAELQTIAARIDAGRDLTAVVYPLSRSKFWPSYRKEIQTSLSGFGIASGLILLLACANVSNLLLGRALARQREMAMRFAIGASAGRIVRQLLTESAVLAVLSGGASLAVARALTQLLRRFPNAFGLTLNLDLDLEWRALAFCLALSVLTVVLFGLAPAAQTARLAIVPALKVGGSAGAGRRHEWLRGGLVAVQAAFAMILLAAGGLYGRALLHAYTIDLGFRSDHLLTAWFSLPTPGSQAANDRWSAQQTLLQKLDATPGVVSAAVSASGILSPGYPKARIESGDSTVLAAAATREIVGRSYFRTMGVPVFEGSAEMAQSGGGDAQVVVNRTLAHRIAPAGSAVGRTILMEFPGHAKSPYLVVGVVGDARTGSVWEQAEPAIYLPASGTDVSAGFLAIRTSAPPAELAEPLRKLWNELTPESPLYDIQTASERVNEALMPQRVAAGILGGFAILSLALTTVGLYSVVAFSVARQRREIGIRIAIGASPRVIFRAILGRSMIPAVAGLAAGMAAAIPLMRVVAAKATGVSPYDVGTYLAVAFLLTVLACAAAVSPARRAMRIDPSIAMRAE